MAVPLEVVEEFARRRGLRFERAGDAARLWHREAPFFIEVRETSRGLLVRLGYEGLKDYIREALDTAVEGEDVRGEIEDLVDEMSGLAYELYEELVRRGYRASLETRTAAMDILGELEEAEEEEE